MLDKEVTLALYSDNRQQLRHHEDQRTLIATIFLSGIGTLVALLAAPPIPLKPNSEKALYFLALALSLFGWLLIEKIDERIALHLRRTHQLLDAADKDSSVHEAIQVLVDSDRRHNRWHPILSHLHLRWFWRLLFLLMTLTIAYSLAPSSPAIARLTGLLDQLWGFVTKLFQTNLMN